MKETYYDVLGITPDASQQEIKAAWRAAVSRFHPDRVDGNAIQTVLFNRAYEVLSDPDARQAYDRDIASDHGSDRREPPPAAATTDQPRSGATPGGTTPGHADDPSLPSWWNPDLRDGTITAVPAFEASRGAFASALLVWGALWVGAMVTVASNGAGSLVMVAVVLCVVLVVPGRWALMLPGGGLLTVAGVVSAVGVVLVGLNAAEEPTGWILTVGALALVGGIPIVRLLAGRLGDGMELNRAIDREMTLELNVWGTPGEPLFAEQEQPYTDRDRWPARATAQLLEPMLDIPGVKVLHGTPSPAQPDVLVEQIAICGRRVAVIESQFWGPGTYTADRYGAFLCDGEHFEGGMPHIADAAAGWQQNLTNARVRGFLVIHADTTLDLDSAAGNTDLQVVTAADAAETIGGFLREEAGTVNRRTLLEILTAIG